VIVFYLFKKGKQPVYLLVAAIIVFIVFYVITSQVTKAIVNRPPPDIKLPADISQANCSDFDGKAIVKALKDDLGL